MRAPTTGRPRIVRIEIRPHLRGPEEVAVENDAAEDQDPEHDFENDAAFGEPAAEPDERPQHERDGKADAASHRLERSGEETHDRIQHMTSSSGRMERAHRHIGSEARRCDLHPRFFVKTWMAGISPPMTGVTLGTT